MITKLIYDQILRWLVQRVAPRGQKLEIDQMLDFMRSHAHTTQIVHSSGEIPLVWSGLLLYSATPHFSDFTLFSFW